MKKEVIENEFSDIVENIGEIIDKYIDSKNYYSAREMRKELEKHLSPYTLVPTYKLMDLIERYKLEDKDTIYDDYMIGFNACRIMVVQDLQSLLHNKENNGK